MTDDQTFLMWRQGWLRRKVWPPTEEEVWSTALAHARRWIPVREGLPSILYDPVVARTTDTDQFYIAWITEDGVWHHGADYPLDGVTHYMPLPPTEGLE